jgi:AbrB family looped-hinge helix DNA binding protein
MITAEGTVGKRGELYPPKEVRELLGLKSGQKVIYRVEGNRLIIEPILSLRESLRLKKFGKTTVKEFQKEREEILSEFIR